jgi:proteasome lid subunit RPN8/RPN11
MVVHISKEIIKEIHAHGEAAYPEEGAGLLLGKANGETREVEAILKLINAREKSARHNRYLLTAQDMMRGEQEAMRLGLEIVGVFHSHPDHPNRPSSFDRDWAMPWFSYLITSVENGQATASRSWRLEDDRESFSEERLVIKNLD